MRVVSQHKTPLSDVTSWQYLEIAAGSHSPTRLRTHSLTHMQQMCALTCAHMQPSMHKKNFMHWCGPQNLPSKTTTGAA